jgi:3',5'-cyclic AMP phosphodiesterase CpdA
VHLSGDPQFKSMTDVGYYRRDIIEPAVALGPVDLAVTMGDLVDDHLELYPALKAEDAKLKAPWLHAPGNHDLDFDAGGDAHSLDSFRHAFGPDTYAWEEPEAAFIVLDDVLFKGPAKSNYFGGLRPDQFEFLEAYLAKAPKDRLLVLALHIPLFPVPGQESFNPADRARLFELLRPFPKLLVLSAHTHKQMTFLHDASTGWQGTTPLREYNIGAACGAYWTGLKDVAGIPDSTMNDGTPNGYARMRIGADGIPHIRYYAARAPLEQQMTVHAPKVLRHNAYPAFGVFANVWMGHAGTVVEYRVDGGEWKPMKKVDLPDPALTVENARDDEAAALRGYDRSPEAVISTHLWRGTLPTNLGAGEHRVEIRAQLDEGQARGEATYRLDEAAP